MRKAAPKRQPRRARIDDDEAGCFGVGQTVWGLPLLVAAVLFGLLGWSQKTASEVSHSDVARYNAAAAAWTAKRLNETWPPPTLRGLHYAPDGAGGTDPDPSAIPLQKDVSADLSNTPFGDHVARYQSVKYTYTGPLDPAGTRNALPWEDEVVSTFSLPPVVGLPAEAAAGIAMTKVVVARIGNWKNCVYARKGAVDLAGGRGTCTTHYRLRSLCFLVKDSPADEWSYVGGCAGDDGEIASYEVVPCSRHARPSSVSFNVIKVTVRHVDDPFLVYRRVASDNRVYFSDSAGTARKLFFVTGSCVVLYIAMVVFQLCSRQQRSPTQYTQQTDDDLAHVIDMRAVR